VTTKQAKHLMLWLVTKIHADPIQGQTTHSEDNLYLY